MFCGQLQAGGQEDRPRHCKHTIFQALTPLPGEASPPQLHSVCLRSRLLASSNRRAE